MGKGNHIQLKSLGPAAILIEWPARIDEHINAEVLAVQQMLFDTDDPGIVECIPAYHSLLVEFDTSIVAKEKLEEQLLSMIASIAVKARKGKHWEIPVRYDGEDFKELCALKKLSPSEFIQLHSAPDYRVFFLGFLPGFLYLGGLDARLHTPRRAAPRTSVPKGAVAIGGQQTGIYPQNSPGGWQLIGHTDFEWFDKAADPPSRITAGDTIKFLPIR